MLMNRNENIGNMSSLCDLFRLFQAHMPFCSVFSQCHASSSQGRGHNTGGKYDGDTQTNTRCPLYLYMSAVQTNVKTPEIRN